MYPQGNSPDSWQQYNQQPDPYAGYGQPPQPPQYPYPPAPAQRSGSRTPLIIVGVVVGVLVLFCAAGVLIVALGAAVDDNPGTDRADAAASSGPPASTRTTPPATPGTKTPTEESIEGDLARFKVGDCLTITGADNTVNPAKCTDSGAYKVLLRRDGTTDEKVCDGTEATDFLYQDGVGTSRDLVLCVSLVK